MVMMTLDRWIWDSDCPHHAYCSGFPKACKYCPTKHPKRVYINDKDYGYDVHEFGKRGKHVIVSVRRLPC